MYLKLVVKETISNPIIEENYEIDNDNECHDNCKVFFFKSKKSNFDIGISAFIVEYRHQCRSKYILLVILSVWRHFSALGLS